MSKKPTRWTAAQDDLLREAWFQRDITLEQICEIVGRGTHRTSVTTHAHKIGLPSRRKALSGHSYGGDAWSNGVRSWTKEEDAILRKLWLKADLTVQDIADRVRPNAPDRRAMYRRAMRMGLPPRSSVPGRKYVAKKKKGPVFCGFPVALVPELLRCGCEADTLGYCETHATLMGLANAA